MITNEDRAKRFAEILHLYPEDERTNVIDLLADAMHWCNLSETDFADVFRVARMHFEAERDEAE